MRAFSESALRSRKAMVLSNGVTARQRSVTSLSHGNRTQIDEHRIWNPLGEVPWNIRHGGEGAWVHPPHRGPLLVEVHHEAVHRHRHRKKQAKQKGCHWTAMELRNSSCRCHPAFHSVWHSSAILTLETSACQASKVSCPASAYGPYTHIITQVRRFCIPFSTPGLHMTLGVKLLTN